MAVLDNNIISIHPLCLLGISDYVTRSKFSSKQSIMIGGLLGSKNNNSITHSFELLLNENGIDETVFQSKLDQFKIIYPNFELIGFYQICENDELIIDELGINLLFSLEFLNLREFIYLTINPSTSQTSHGIPIKISPMNDLKSQFFFKIESAPSEKSSLNSINESILKPVVQKPSELFTQRNHSLRQNLMNLNDKILKLQTYLTNEEEDDDDELLMEIDKFLLELECIKSNSFKEELTDRKKELLMTACSNLMILMSHNLKN